MRKPDPQNGKRHATQQSLNGAIKSICDVMRRCYLMQVTRLVTSQSTPAR